MSQNTDTRREDKADRPADDEPVDAVKDAHWGEIPQDHFGYASEEERLAKRGLEDWELVERMPESQRGVPRWFLGIIVMVMLVAIGLSFPFWGDRPGYEREWVNWGFGAAILYIVVFGGFVYFMVNVYSTHVDGEHVEEDGERAPEAKAGVKPAAEQTHDAKP